MKNIQRILTSLIFLFLFINAQASDLYLVGLMDNSFIRGQFICKEVNEYGDMEYACGGRTSDGSVRGLASHEMFALPDSFFVPYHDPKKINILSVSITGFNGEIQTDGGEQIFSCQFPMDSLASDTRALIELYATGDCVVRPYSSEFKNNK